jgi:hypothetical protein
VIRLFVIESSLKRVSFSLRLPEEFSKWLGLHFLR